MKKTLVVVSHPNIAKSVINQRWIKELEQYPQLFTVHELYKTYLDGKIDIAKEQALIEEHNNLILQFPMYWFNCTPLLKQWLDEVFTYGWAYGSTGNQLKNKNIALAVSIGRRKDEFVEPFTVNTFLRSFEMVTQYVKANYKGTFALYGASTEPGRNTITEEQIEQSAKDYIQFLNRL